MRKVRRKDREISESDARSLLKRAAYGVLSTVDNDGRPYGVPLSFCVIDNCIYFHSAVEGQKIDNIIRNKSVSFCIVGDTKILPDKFSIKYESVILFGEVEEVFDTEKQAALEGLLRKYSPDFFDRGIKYIDETRDQTRVFKISINQLTGKARR